MRMKKFLAILIVLALTASLIPTSFAAAEEAANYNYVFNTAAHVVDSSKLVERRLTSGLHTIDNMATTSESSPWGFVNAYGCNTPVSYDARVLWEIKDEEGVGVAFAPGVSDKDVTGIRSAIVFEISASEGTYDASLSVTTGTSPATEVEVYLVPKGDHNFPSDYTVDATTNLGTFKESFYKNHIETLSANYRIGKVDLCDKRGDVYIGRTTLDQSNYYLVLVPCGVNKDAVANKNSWIMNLTNFKLDSVGESAVEVNVKTLTPEYHDLGKKYDLSTENNVFSASNIQVRFYGVTTSNGPFAAFKVNVDVSGTYNLSFKTNTEDAKQAAPAVYYSQIESASDMKSITPKTLLGYFDFSKLTADTYQMLNTDAGIAADLELTAGKNYYIILAPDAKSLEINGETTTGTLSLGTHYTNVDNVVKDMDGGTYKNNTTLGYQNLYLSGIKLTQVVEPSAEETERAEAYTADRELYNTLTTATAENNTVNPFEYDSTATVTVVTQDIATGDKINADFLNENKAVNEEVTVEVPTVSADYEFMYWAIGLGANRKIVSFDKDEYSFTVAPGRNMVYAVYRKTNNDTKYAFFFDGSKTVLGKKAITDKSVTLPELPGAMPGFGDSIGWKYTGEKNEVALLAGDEVTNLTDDTFFVADYEGQKTITLTIDGKEVKVPYGEDVNLGDYAWLRENKSGYKVFNYWMKDSKIISFKPDYTFKAYEDCTLTSTYAQYEPLNKTVRRILLSADSETGITFAEFIGLDSANEKGILFCDETATTYADAKAKAVMQTDGNIFSVVNETEKTAIGYAILSGGKIVYSGK